MEKVLTHIDAWNDFYQWIGNEKTRGEISRIPKDVQEAQYAANGLRKYGLGERRIQNLLEKYAPGRYEFREQVILNENLKT